MLDCGPRSDIRRVRILPNSNPAFEYRTTCRPLHPVLTVAVDLHYRAAGLSLTVCAKPREHEHVAAIRRPQPAVRNLEQIILDLPDVREGQAPVVPAEGAQIN